MNNVQAAKEAYGAFGSGNMTELESKFSDDVVWISSDEMPDGGEIHGSSEVIAAFEHLVSTWPTFSVVPEEFIDGGEWVTVRGTETLANEKGTVTTPYAHLIKFDHGKIVRSEFLVDTAKTTSLL